MPDHSNDHALIKILEIATAVEEYDGDLAKALAARVLDLDKAIRRGGPLPSQWVDRVWPREPIPSTGEL